jgi:hypothetical protein
MDALKQAVQNQRGSSDFSAGPWWVVASAIL